MNANLEKLAQVIRDNFSDYEIDKLFEASTGTLVDVLETIPAEEPEEEVET